MGGGSAESVGGGRGRGGGRRRPSAGAPVRRGPVVGAAAVRRAAVAVAGGRRSPPVSVGAVAASVAAVLRGRGLGRRRGVGRARSARRRVARRAAAGVVDRVGRRGVAWSSAVRGRGGRVVAASARRRCGGLPAGDRRPRDRRRRVRAWLLRFDPDRAGGEQGGGDHAHRGLGADDAATAPSAPPSAIPTRRQRLRLRRPTAAPTARGADRSGCARARGAGASPGGPAAPPADLPSHRELADWRPTAPSLKPMSFWNRASRPDRGERRERPWRRAELGAEAAACVAVADVAADRAGGLAQALGRLGELEPDLAAGQQAGLARLGERDPRPHQQRLDGGQRGVHRLRDLLVGEVVHLAQEQRRALGLGKLVDVGEDLAELLARSGPARASMAPFAYGMDVHRFLARRRSACAGGSGSGCGRSGRATGRALIARSSASIAVWAVTKTSCSTSSASWVEPSMWRQKPSRRPW